MKGFNPEPWGLFVFPDTLWLHKNGSIYLAKGTANLKLENFPGLDSEDVSIRRVNADATPDQRDEYPDVYVVGRSKDELWVVPAGLDVSEEQQLDLIAQRFVVYEGPDGRYWAKEIAGFLRSRRPVGQSGPAISCDLSAAYVRGSVALSVDDVGSDVISSAQYEASLQIGPLTPAQLWYITHVFPEEVSAEDAQHDFDQQVTCATEISRWDNIAKIVNKMAGLEK